MRASSLSLARPLVISAKDTVPEWSVSHSSKTRLILAFSLSDHSGIIARATGAGAASLPGAPSVAWATSTMEAMLGGLPAVVVFRGLRCGGGGVRRNDRSRPSFREFSHRCRTFVVVGLSSFSGRSGRNTWSDANDSLAERQPDCVVCVSLSTAELGEIQAGAEIGSVLNPVGIIRPRTRLESHQRPRRRSIFPCNSFGSGLSAESLSSLRVITRAHARVAALVDRTVDHGEHVRGDARDGARSPIGRRGSKRRTSPRGGSRFV